MIRDQLGRLTFIPESPQRIISLVPSQTELLFELGLEEEVVGITKFCIHPREQFKNKPKVGGTKQLKREVIDALQPDLIIGNKEENDALQIRELMEVYPVWMSDIYDLSDALEMIRSVGTISDRTEPANELAAQIQSRFQEFQAPGPARRVAYFIWREPYMVAANDTFIHQMLLAAGFENVFADRSRYPEIRLEELAAQKPDIIFLSSEPFPFREKHFPDFKNHLPNIPIQIVDGEYFSWYGSRLLGAPAYFQALWDRL